MAPRSGGSDSIRIVAADYRITNPTDWAAGPFGQELGVQAICDAVCGAKQRGQAQGEVLRFDFLKEDHWRCEVFGCNGSLNHLAVTPTSFELAELPAML